MSAQYQSVVAGMAGSASIRRNLISQEDSSVFIAYIDPGAGSMLIQALLAGVLAVPFFLRTHIRSVLTRVRNRGERGDATEE
jgi:hypothetical protein